MYKKYLEVGFIVEDLLKSGMSKREIIDHLKNKGYEISENVLTVINVVNNHFSQTEQLKE